MGADLIVNILFGRGRFTKTQINRAIKYATKVQKEAKWIDSKMGDDFEMSDEDISKSPIRHALEYEQHDTLDDARDVIETMAGIDPVELVNEFVQWWNTCSGRDTSGRYVPNTKMKQKVVVCGDMSHGESPDGYGYQLVRKAEWFNIINTLGIL